MPSHRPSRKEAQKKELAELLNEPVLTRSEAAKKLGISAGTLNVEPNDWPPYYSKGPKQVALYPLSGLDEFLAKGTVASRRDKGFALGRQPWPPAPPIPSAKVAVLQALFPQDPAFVMSLLGEEDDGPDEPGE